MFFYLIGIDYKTAPLSVREAVYRKRKKLDGYLDDTHFRDAKMFYTCNRTELYGVTRNLSEARTSICIFQRQFREFSNNGYIILGQRNVFRHLLRLATGLESQIKGEPQILQQLYTWHLQDLFFEPLSCLVHKAVSSAGDIRIKAGLNQAENSIATLVSKDLARRFENRKRLEAVIVGTGNIAGLFVTSKHPQLYLYFAGHKNYVKAQELANRSKGEALMLKDLPEVLLRVDGLISATSSPHFLFDEDYFRKFLDRRDKPLYLYDLAMPRDINPDVADLRGIVLNNPDTLTEVFNEDSKGLRISLLLAENMVEEAMKEYEEISYEERFKDGDAAEPLSLKAS